MKYCNIVAYCIHKQEVTKCTMVLQQHRMWSAWISTWAKKSHHYCFAKKVCIFTNRKPLVAILNKCMAILLQLLQCILLWIHIIYKPGPDLYMLDWLSDNNQKKKKQEMEVIRVNVNAISTSVNIPVCTSIQDTQRATCEDVHLQKLKAYIVQAWSCKEWRSSPRNKAILTNKEKLINDKWHCDER